MRFPQVLVYEHDGRLAELLRREGTPFPWSLREPRRPETCLRLLRRGGPNVLLLKIGTDLLEELSLLDRVSQSFLHTATVVVGDTDNPVVAGLAWDLGAALVLCAPLPRHYLTDIIARLLQPAVEERALVAEPDEDPGADAPAEED